MTIPAVHLTDSSLEDPPKQQTLPIKPNNAPFALKRFIENAQREIASLSDPDEIAAAKERLHAEMLRKFTPEEPKPFKSQVRDVSLAECEADLMADHVEYMKQEAESDSLAKLNDAVEPEVWEEDREPRTRMQKTNVAKATSEEIRSWDGRLKKEKDLPAEIRSYPVQAAGLEFAGNYSAAADPVDAVNEGDYFEQQHAEFTPTRPYHDRVAGVMFRASQAWKKSSNLILYCQRDGCGQVFQGRKGTKFCSDDCRKRDHEQKNAAKTRS
jgi:hypothetical protein